VKSIFISKMQFL